MHFESVQTINNPTAGIFQDPGILDVALFIKTGAKFHQNHYFFSIFGSFHQRIHDLALLCQTVKCHLDGNYTVVSGCLIQ